MNYSTYSYPADVTLITEIEKAINGECSAITCYEQLAKHAPSEEARGFTELP
ncbi:ferritin family protein [Paenibacillus tyrfis]|uniref:hypothetical protein n=1 Tax=Paenibacillus tyrfis TaxID=1501230 RepID=UPI001376783A|nr:hypothetical protein [Paenibacillus tyrfis]